MLLCVRSDRVRSPATDGRGRVVGIGPRRALVRAVRPVSWGRTRTARIRQRCHRYPRPPSRVSDRRASTVATVIRPTLRCERPSGADAPAPRRRSRSTITNSSMCRTEGRWSAFIHAVPDNSSVSTNPLSMARSTSRASPSRASTRSASPRRPLVASNVEAQTSASLMVDDTVKTSACQVSPQAVSPAAATGPPSSNQTGSASSSVTRGRRHHHCTSAASHMPPSGSACRARCRTVVVASSRLTPRSSSRRTTTFAKRMGRIVAHDESGCSPLSGMKH